MRPLSTHANYMRCGLSRYKDEQGLLPEGAKLFIANNPIVKNLILMLRDRDCPSTQFRANLHSLGYLLTYEAIGLLPLQYRSVAFRSTYQKRTDLDTATPGLHLAIQGDFIDDRDVSLICALRSALPLSNAAQLLFPLAAEGHIIAERKCDGGDVDTVFMRLPENPAKLSIFFDTIIATGKTAVHLVQTIEKKFNRLDVSCFICVAATIEGLQTFFGRYPEIPMVLGDMSDKLDDWNQMKPGFGEIDDRIYNTKYDLTSHKYL